MLKIIPSILTNDPLSAKEMFHQAESVVDRVSIDIIDGKFAGNKTIEPDIFADIEPSIKIDYQLMVIEPVNWIEKCVLGQADRIIGHIEHMASQMEFIQRVQEVGAKVGLGLDLKTPISRIDPAIINNLDVVLLMSVPAGFGGQKFHPEVLEKVKKLNQIRSSDNTSFAVHVDGGVSLDYINALEHGMVDEVSIGNRLFNGNLRDNILEYQEKAQE